MNSPNSQKYSSTMVSLKLLNGYGIARYLYPNCVRKCSVLLSLSEFEENLWNDLAYCFKALTQIWGTVRITVVGDGKTRNVKYFFYVSSHWHCDKISDLFFDSTPSVSSSTPNPTIAPKYQGFLSSLRTTLLYFGKFKEQDGLFINLQCFHNLNSRFSFLLENI